MISQQQRVLDPKLIKSMTHLSNVKSVDDVLSSLSAKSPKFRAKMVGNESNQLLSIDSPDKFKLRHNEDSMSNADHNQNEHI